MSSAPPLSHSSAMMLLSCEQKFCHYKVLRTPDDPDYEKSNALAVGSAFHWILEKARHEKPKSITHDLQICQQDPTIGLAEEDVPLVHALVLRYLRLHRDSGLRVLAIETEVRTETDHSYIDAIMEDGDGNWSIVDLKTWKTISDAQIKQLTKDAQLNLYASQVPILAETLGLLPEKFVGVRWRVVCKSAAKQKRGEEYVDYVKRLVEAVKAYDIFVPKEHLSIEERRAEHVRLWRRSAELREDPTKAYRNYKACFDFFSPCSYFSKCHGRLFSDEAPIIVTEG